MECKLTLNHSVELLGLILFLSLTATASDRINFRHIRFDEKFVVNGIEIKWNEVSILIEFHIVFKIHIRQSFIPVHERLKAHKNTH